MNNILLLQNPFFEDIVVFLNYIIQQHVKSVNEINNSFQVNCNVLKPYCTPQFSGDTSQGLNMINQLRVNLG